MRADLVTKLLWGGIFLLCTFYLAVFWFIPLSFSLDDAGRYYALAHFLLTGEHIAGTYLQSFNEPSQFYALFGYPFILYLVKQLGTLLGIHWIWLLKLLQLAVFAYSARILYLLSRIYSTHKTGLGAVLMYLLSIAYFHFANVALSENITILLILGSVYLYIKGLRLLSNKRLITWALLMAYSCFYKPVLLVAFIFMIILLPILLKEKRKFSLVLVVLFALPFVGHSLANKALLGTYTIRTGLGWNLWNRIIYIDGSVPKDSDDWTRYNKEIVDAGDKDGIPTERWWIFARKLSDLGYNERQTQEICLSIALDGLKENKLRYLGGTFVVGWKNLTSQVFPVSVYPSYTEHFDRIAGYMGEERNVPLATEILKTQAGLANCTACASLHSAWFTFTQWHKKLMYPWWNYFILVLVLLWSIRWIAGSRAMGPLMFWSGAVPLIMALIILFGSALVEVPHPRYNLPAYTFFICMAAVTLAKLRSPAAK